MAKKITAKQIEAVLAALRGQFGVTDPADGPQLQRDYEGWGGSATAVAIVWDGGPHDWAIGAFSPHITEFGSRVEGAVRPAGIFSEPINGYALGVYRDDSEPERVPRTWAQLDAEEAAERPAREAARAAREAADAEQVKGMVAEILTGPYHSPNGGISATHQQVLVVGANVPRVFAAGDLPVVEVGETLPGHTVLRPVDRPDGAVGPMASGAYVVTSDGRWPFAGPVPLHDRFETPAQYDVLSR